ncbi:MAG: glycosyl hydrolase [Bacteroidales bacterium]|nr:glycosyl hydrolase [Bacteroidales bacterium]
MKFIKTSIIICLAALLASCTGTRPGQSLDDLKQSFLHPPDSARPGVYWYFMDGNMTKEGMTKDLESMKEVGIGNVVFLEVNVGVPRGKVDFLSEEWLDNFTHMVRESERLGITITLGVGPGWTGSGGPWVKGSESMKHLVASATNIAGGEKISVSLPVPEAKAPYFGLQQFPEELKKRWEEYYEDVAVLAYPTPSEAFKIPDIDEKALYYREPYTSKPGVKQFLPTFAEYRVLPEGAVVEKDKVTDITSMMDKDGVLSWDAPEGNWTIIRFGKRNNGAITRPAPLPGVGFEADKFDTAGINAHLRNFTEKLFARTGVPDASRQGGLKMLHMDSWEMGAQNWTELFREEFTKRRGYDPMPFYPVYTGQVVGSLELSERFLWDLRQTSTELIVENHAMHLKAYGRKYNMGFSIEPYDMNPTADMELGGVADVPMCEFWSKDYGFISAWSCIQAASIAHINNNPVVAAEAFTAHLDAWKIYPGSMKNQGDWAFSAGVNRLVYHTWQHQCLDDDLKPGMTMGPYGIHHDRNQTWWPMADGYHSYVTRSQFMLQNGKPVADILYLTPEGAPQVFRAPSSAMTADNTNQETLQLGDFETLSTGKTKDEIMPDRKAYNFSGCSPTQLLSASVKNNKVVFPGGAEFHLLVLPAMETMTPELLTKISGLVKAGAIITGNPPLKSPSLVNFPECDQMITSKAKELWGLMEIPSELTITSYGKGKIYWGGELYSSNPDELYPHYDQTASILEKMGVKKDFQASPDIRYIHKKMETCEYYFVSNKKAEQVNTTATFNVNSGYPELWDPITGETRPLPEYSVNEGLVSIDLQFEPWQSYFIVFSPEKPGLSGKDGINFPAKEILTGIEGPWEVYFDPTWGGPGKAIFDEPEDWILNKDEGIKYYSGIAVYKNKISIPAEELNTENRTYHLNTGKVMNLARVFVNGKDMGVIWTAPWEVNITGALVAGDNEIEIHVANLWPNRLIGDEHLPDDGIKEGQWPEWVLENTERPSERVTFTTFRHYKKDDKLLPSGLLGPVKILVE